jgi:hypothetical protein
LKTSTVVGKLPDYLELVDDYSGSEPFDVHGFTKGRMYKPIALYVYGFEDGGTILVFAVPDDSGRIRNVACTKFKVV